MIKVQILNARKLLTATAGLATVSYLGATSCSLATSSGNLMAPEGTGGEQATGSSASGGNYTSGNLVAPYPGGSSGDCDEGGRGGAGGEDGKDAGGCVVR